MSLFEHTVDIFSSHVVLNRVMQSIGVSCIAIILTTYCVQIFYYYLHAKKLEKEISNDHSDSQINSENSQSSVNSTTKKANKAKKKLKKNLSGADKKAYYYVYLARFLTILIQIIFLIFLTLFTCNFFAVFENNCNSMANIAVTIWNLARFSLYYLFVLRLKIAFANSIFDYRNSTIAILLFWITFCLCWQVWTAAVEVSGENKTDYCQIYVPYIAVGMAIAADGSISLICLVLFIKPLIYIMKHSDASEKEFQNTVVKYTLLAVIAIVSSGLWFITQIFIPSGGALSAVDSVINTLCVALMDNQSHYFYTILCKPCVRVFSKCCSACHNKTEI